jgi:hypothetical protein
MAASRRPGPTCQSSYPLDIDDGTLCLQVSPTPGSVTTADRAPKTIKVTLNCLEFGRDALLRFLRSVATTVAIDKLTVVEGGGGSHAHPMGPFPAVDQIIVRLVAGEKTIELASHADVDTRYRFVTC